MKLSSQFKQRIAMSGIALFLLTIALSLSYIPYFKIIFLLLSGGVAVCALFEYYNLVENKGFHPLIWVGIGSTVAYFIAVFWSVQNSNFEHLPALILLATLLGVFAVYFYKRENPLSSLAVTLFGICYLTIPISFSIKINYFFGEHSVQDGRLWLIYVLAVSKITDAGAYFVGKGFGAHKLLPHISPKKTIEGAVGGTLLGILTSVCFYLIFSRHGVFSPLDMTFLQSVILGLVLTFFAQFGDLCESILKRDAGVKDSSHLPGLGGILDIVDSLIFTLPITYFVLQADLLG